MELDWYKFQRRRSQIPRSDSGPDYSRKYDLTNTRSQPVEFAKKSSFDSSSRLQLKWQNDLTSPFCAMGLGLHSSYPLSYATYAKICQCNTAIRARSGFELIMRNRLKTSTVQRQRDISLLSARIKIKSRHLRPTISCSRFRIKHLQDAPIQSSFHRICPLNTHKHPHFFHPWSTWPPFFLSLRWSHSFLL